MVRVAAMLALTCAAARSPAALACAPAPPQGQQIVTEREDALIVWDAPSHREHFVRRALFGGVIREFGFLVPTPSRPELEEASEAVFAELDRVTEPSVIIKQDWVAAPVGCTMLPWMFLRAGSKAAPSYEASAVTLLEEKRVAGLDATVLEASDAAALAAWLEARGFAFRPALRAWVEPYLASGWKITAFRYAGDARLPGSNLASRALRMSFATDAPIYPYREPEDQLTLPLRELRLFLLATSPLEAAPFAGREPWPAALRFSASLQLPGALGQALPGVSLPGSAWLVEYRDRTSKRPPTDLSFVAAIASREVRPEPVIVYHQRPVPIPYEAPLVLGGVAWWWQRRRRRASG
jgi:hypothetical protein